MKKSKIKIPDEVKFNALAKGKIGKAWLESLDQLIARICEDWNLSMSEVLSGGTEALVMEVRSFEGERGVLKITLSGSDSFDRELQTLLLANGNGYVQIKRYDTKRRAILLERLGPQLHQLGLSVDSQIEMICSTLKKAWMPLPKGFELISAAEKAKNLVGLIDTHWEVLGRPCLERTIEMARLYGKMRIKCFDKKNSVLNHGDAHAWNTLAISENDLTQFKFIDPDPVFAERAYDLGIPMREWSSELLSGDPLVKGRERCSMLSRLTGEDAESIWQWGFLQRVSNGLLCLQNASLEEEGRKILAVADAWSKENQ